jgi:flagellar hook protein FlgE
VYPANATATFQMSTNLNADAAVGTVYSAPMTVYDSLGNAHNLTINYTNTAANAWTYQVTIPAADQGGTGAPVQLATGNMTFGTNGALTAPTGTIPGIAINGLADGAANMSLTWNLNGTSGAPTITQEASTSATTASTQDGYSAGSLTSYSILPDGTVQGTFSNNQTLVLGQVAIASFANNQGLTQVGNSDYQASFASGTPIIGQAGVGGNGTITGGAVEGSNVNLSTEFANMIVAQQGYEANAKVLTTLDQVSQATLQVIS